MKKRTVFKNLLVQYKGGGYDGCHWEWNFFLFDEAGQFHDVGSSGRRAIKTREVAVALLNQPDDVERSWHYVEFYEYRLNVKKDRREFVSENAASNVAGVTRKVNDIYGRDLMTWTCNACENESTGEMFHSGYRGNGGVGVTMMGQLCEDCYCSGICPHCGEYDDREQVEMGDDYGCPDCAEYAEREKPKLELVKS